MKKNKKNKKPIKYSKKVIAVCIASIWAFVILSFIALVTMGTGFSDALVWAFFGVFGLEFFSLAKIKKAEIDKSQVEKIEEDINIDDLEKEINEAIEAGK